ncbi:alpha-amylase family protein [Vibrio sp.]|uniref:alpha-amylase family protein n=1 Tax=Vibrio sp. TaxID=678 RepID=UPI003D0A3E38
MTHSNHTDVILHTFDWPYAMIAERAGEIHQAGYKSVLVSPPMKSLKRNQGTQWWQRYQPQDYRIIDNQLGDTQDFKQMLAQLALYDISVYADVVFNHMANESSSRSDLNYPSADDLQQYRHDKEYYQSIRLFGDLSKPLFTEQDFVEAFGIQDWQDKWQVQNGRITGGQADPGLPTLRDNDHVVAAQRAYLTALKKLGVKGFRIDAAKHMTLEHLKKVWSDDITRDVHIFGEIITDGGSSKAEYELFLQPYLENTELGAYDFPLFQTLFDALQPQGSLKTLVDPYCFGQALSHQRAITFAITHDIPNNDVFRDLVMDEALEWLAYSYILGRDGGVPLIYTDLDTSGIQDQKKQPRWLSSWRDPRMTARLEFHNRMHGLAMKTIEAGDDLLVLGRYEAETETLLGVVVINKSQREQTVELLLTQPVVDLISGQRYRPKDEQVTLSVAGLSSLMLVNG